MTPIPLRSPLRRPLTLVLLPIVAVVAVLAARAYLHRAKPEAAVQVEPVERRTIVVTVEATGTVEPVHTVEVKSKASGQIVRMPVEVGSVVRTGDLLAQIDTLNVQNQYDQALAALQAAMAQVDVATAQKRRADELFESQVITADEHEAATLTYANAQSGLVRARTDLDIARQNLEDATVRAPISGTVIAQPVSVGQVISSATSSVSGGTTLLSMADLRRIRIRALVAESDIGSVQAGQSATVLMDAFPKRPFRGEVEKIEPQAVVQQSVTLFPVLIAMSNEEGLLMPGMNGEVSVMVQRRADVLAVPLDAVRGLRELPAVASALGLDPSALREGVHGQFREPDSGGSRPGSGLAAAATDSGSAGVAGVRGGQRGSGAWRRRATGGAVGSGAAGTDGGAGAAGSRDGGSGAGTRNAGIGRSAGGQAQVVLVKTEAGFQPRIVRLGVTDFDYAEVLSGLREGDRVALLSVVEVQAQRNETMNRIRQRVGGGVPGVGGGSRTSGGGRRGGS
ncbi:MAG TPA: efflux RND transporter periplasmic adaptor subunit [Candidatus Eisenbacteria bacterium]